MIVIYDKKGKERLCLLLNFVILVIQIYSLEFVRLLLGKNNAVAFIYLSIFFVIILFLSK